MNICIILTFLIVCCVWNTVSVEPDSEALRECGNLHHFEFRSIPNAVANYSNNSCMLKCSIGEKVLSNDAINEGFACPRNSNGVNLDFIFDK